MGRGKVWQGTVQYSGNNSQKEVKIHVFKSQLYNLPSELCQHEFFYICYILHRIRIKMPAMLTSWQLYIFHKIVGKTF